MPQPNLDTQNLFGEPHGTAILTSAEIEAMVQNGRLIVDGSFDSNSLQATSYDIRIGKKGILAGSGNEIDLNEARLVVEPGSYAGVLSFEKVKLPNNVFAHIGSKRKWSYEGIILLTGSSIDPGYEGHLLFGLYNASTKKVVLPMKSKICNVVFFRLPHDVRPVASDTYLQKGDFPHQFLSNMANVEVLPWARISEEVRRIQELAQAVLDLKAQYNDVLEPIKTLTTNVDKVNTDVRLLTEHIKTVEGQVTKLEQLSEKNAHLVSEVSLSVKSLVTKVDDQDKEVRDVSTKLGRYGLLVYAAWGL